MQEYSHLEDRHSGILPRIMSSYGSTTSRSSFPSPRVLRLRSSPSYPWLSHTFSASPCNQVFYYHLSIYAQQPTAGHPRLQAQMRRLDGGHCYPTSFAITADVPLLYAMQHLKHHHGLCVVGKFPRKENKPHACAASGETINTTLASVRLNMI